MSLTTRSRYRPVVRLGNWFEDICLDEQRINIFKDMRNNGELLVEKTRMLFNHFHKPVSLGAPQQTISFGATIQVKPVGFRICEYMNPDAPPALSIIINERVVRDSQHINHECEMSVAPSHAPCVRNTFRIVSKDDNERENEFLKYGQQFRLECVREEGSDTHDPLWLFTTQKSSGLSTMIRTTHLTSKVGEVNLPLGLCRKSNVGPGKPIPAAYANWYCQHIDPHKRFETEGTPLPSNQALVITHVATNRNLAAENVVVQTLFGPEFLVSVQTYKNIYKREIWKNTWMFSNGHQIA